MSDALYIVASGSRFGPDEGDPRRLPDGVSFGSAADGGFTSLDWGVRRTLSDETLEQMYGPVRVVDEQGATVWQGELRRPNPSSIVGTKSTVSPSAVGLKELREDRKDVRWLGIDRDLSHVQGPPYERQKTIIAGTMKPSAAGPNGGTLRFDCTGQWMTNAGRPQIEAFYNPSPARVGRVFWQRARKINVGGNDWKGELFTAAIDGTAGSAVGSDWITTTAGGTAATPVDEAGQNLATPTGSSASAPAVGLLVAYTQSGLTMTDELPRYVDLANLGFVGEHGLTLYGSSAADYGLRPDEVLRYLIPLYCPGLVAGDIQVAPLAVPHTVSLEPTTVGAIANDLNGYLGWTNAVWENGEWDFHPFGEGRRSRTWQVDVLDEGVTLTRAGDDGSTILSGVVVAYRDGGGRTFTVGPGGSVAHAFDDRLRDTTSAASQAGRERIDVYDLGVPSTQEVATAAGQVYLASRNAAKRSGTAEIRGRVLDVNSGERLPSYWMRGGDLLIVTGRGDSAPIRIVEQTYGDGTNRLTLDSGDQDASQILSSLLANQLVGRL